MTSQGIPYTYEQLHGALKCIVDDEIVKHKVNQPDEVFDLLFTYFDEDKQQWMGQIRFVNKSVCDL